jgi:hypothetical protein
VVWPRKRGEVYRVVVTHNPIRGLLVVCVFMPYAMACPTASIQRKAAPLRTFSIETLELSQKHDYV